MKKLLSIVLVICILGAAVGAAAFADDEAPAEAPAAEDNLVTTSHSAVIQGEEIDYTATAGTMVVESGGEQCEIFFVAYTRDDVDDLSERPITFVFNGGPGSADGYTHMLCMGPRTIELSENGHAASLPARMTDNNDSLLDLTDLVFIDAVGTGFSRAVSGDDSNFIGYTNDARTFGDFIRLYVSRNARWGSPKYVAGESYGTTRAIALNQYLAGTYSMGLNGIILISSINDFSLYLFGTGNDLPYITFLPTLAADAWYHGRVAEQYQSMELADYLDEVRAFASGDYLSALFRGQRLSASEEDAIAEKMASFTGLDKDYILRQHLRISLDDFCAELLKDQKLMVGRYDGRYTGPVIGGSLDASVSDPSGFDIDLPLYTALNQYIQEDLGFQTDVPYIPLSMDVNNRWDFEMINGFLTQEDVIHDNMSSNSFLKIWVCCGCYDGATPFYGAEWLFNHLFLDESRQSNLSFSYYPAGHMFYLDRASHDQFRRDAENWYLTGSTAQPALQEAA